MGSQTKYDKKELVYVTIVEMKADGGAAGETLKYCFPTNIPTGERQNLGHVAVTEAMQRTAVNGLVMGCSYPKPNRATKRDALRVTSSYFSHTKSKAALAKVGYLNIRRFTGTAKIINSASALVKTVFVTINGVRYAWNMPKTKEINFPKDVALSALGIVDPPAGADYGDIVRGATMPKPGKAQAVLINGDNMKMISSFYDPDKALPDTFSPVKPARRTLL